FGDVDTVRHKNKVLDEWCATIGRNPKEIERTIAIEPKEVERADEYAEAGADHLILMIGSPFDLAPVERFIASR
ncbi:MAG: LLM class F420-dependent oxidoreductase, partial [Ilumatobacteraceae bacterium]